VDCPGGRTHVQIPAVRNWRFIIWDVACPSPYIKWHTFYSKEPELLWTGSRFPAQARLVFLQDCQARSGGRLSLDGYPKGVGGLFLRRYRGRSVKDTTELHLVYKLRMSLWRCASLSTEIILAYLLHYCVLLLIILLR
jgi:hypothetical protein